MKYCAGFWKVTLCEIGSHIWGSKSIIEGTGKEKNTKLEK